MMKSATPWLVAIAGLAFAVATWYGRFRMPFYPRDMISLSCSVLIVIAILARFRQRLSSSLPWKLPMGAAGAILLLSWMITSSTDHLLGDRPIDKKPELRAAPQAAGKLRVGLALSGGGHRAAVLHTGSIFELERLGVTITNLSVVSGGSIIGAFYALGGSPRAFLEAETNGLLSVRREAGHVESLLSYLPHRTIKGTTLIHRRVLDRRVLQGLTLKGWSELPGRPLLMIGTTDLITGDLIGIVPRGVLRCPISTLQTRLASSLQGDVQRPSTSQFLLADDVGLAGETLVADLLAASSAIPGVFPAVSVGRDSALNRLALVDGGVSDNSGLRLLLEADFQARAARKPTRAPSASPRESRIEAYRAKRYAALQGWAVDLIIASDGGFAFLRTTPPDVLEQLGRSLSIMQANSSAGGLDQREILGRFPGRIILVTPDLLVPKVLGESFLTRESIRQQMVFRYQTNRAYPGGSVTPFAELSDEERAALVAILPERRRLRAESMLAEARSSRFDYTKPVSPLSRAPMPGFRAFELVASDLASCLLTFTRVSTVTDKLEPVQAERLFRLGRYLVQLQRRSIQAALSNRSLASLGHSTLEN